MKIFKILCAALILTGGGNFGPNNIDSLCSGIVDFWELNSNNTYKFQKKVISYKTSTLNLNNGEQEIIKKFSDYDLYVIVNSKNKVSHAGNGVAHLKNTLIRTGAHEVGHLLGLGHSNRLINQKVEFYEDHFSVMGKYPSNTLAGPQYGYLGFVKFESNKSGKLCRILDWKCDGTFVLKNGGEYNSLYSKDKKLIIISYTCPNNCGGTINTGQFIIGKEGKTIGNYRFTNNKGIVTYEWVN